LKDNDNFIYTGCKNKYLYGHDLRENTRLFVHSMYEHDSCIEDMVFRKSTENYLYSSDFTGQIYLWDVRMNSLVHKYTNNSDLASKCSLKLSNCENYLYTSKLSIFYFLL
jgi:WD40 repeat protein